MHNCHIPDYTKKESKLLMYIGDFSRQLDYLHKLITIIDVQNLTQVCMKLILKLSLFCKTFCYPFSVKHSFITEHFLFPMKYSHYKFCCLKHMFDKISWHHKSHCTYVYIMTSSYVKIPKHGQMSMFCTLIFQFNWLDSVMWLKRIRHSLTVLMKFY